MIESADFGSFSNSSRASFSFVSKFRRVSAESCGKTSRAVCRQLARANAAVLNRQNRIAKSVFIFSDDLSSDEAVALESGCHMLSRQLLRRLRMNSEVLCRRAESLDILPPRTCSPAFH